LSALSLDGAGYIHLKFGEKPIIRHLSLIFKDCVDGREVSQTWKGSRTPLSYKKGPESEMKNGRPITVTGCIFHFFSATMTQRIQEQHRSDKLKIFSRWENGFVQGKAGRMEHAILIRDMIIHATMHRKDLYMVHFDFSNASESVPSDLILGNMTAMGIPTTVVQWAKNIDTDKKSKITLTGGDSPFIQWQRCTVQGCPLSPTLFNISPESFL
jgi:hypothetical protein